MLNFEEELKKFQPSPEVDELEDTIDRENSADVTELLKEILNDRN
jgi:hypothetical protein